MHCKWFQSLSFSITNDRLLYEDSAARLNTLFKVDWLSFYCHVCRFLNSMSDGLLHTSNRRPVRFWESRLYLFFAYMERTFAPKCYSATIAKVVAYPPAILWLPRILTVSCKDMFDNHFRYWDWNCIYFYNHGKGDDTPGGGTPKSEKKDKRV